MMNSIYNYAKKSEVKNLRQPQKEKGHYFNISGTNPIKDITSEQNDKKQEHNHANRLEKIISKMQNGETLSSEEMEYLRKNAPELYEKAVQINSERTTFEHELKNCKTKEDVQRLKMHKTASHLAQLNGISNNPDLSDKQKADITELMQMKAAAVNNVALAFVQNGSYARLKSESEKNIEVGKELEERIDILLDNECTEDTPPDNVCNGEKLHITASESAHAKDLYQKALKTVQQSTQTKTTEMKSYI